MATVTPKSSKIGTETLYRWLANVPWWIVIILIVGTIAGYSVLTRTDYLDVIDFVLGLPWDKELYAEAERQEDGTWRFQSSSLTPGNYRLYAEFQDEDDETVGQTETQVLQIPEEVEKALIKPLEAPPATSVEEQITALIQDATSAADEKVETILFYDDLTLVGTLRKIWLSDGVLLTIKTTFLAFITALVLGLIFGLARVSSRNPDLIEGLGLRLLVGLGVAIVVIVVWWVLKGSTDGLRFSTLLLILVGTEVTLFLLPVLPYTISTIYVEVVRGIPMLVIILYMGFVVTPLLRDASDGKFNLQGLPAATIGLAFGYGAYLAEVYRAGIESIHRGQMEAARSLGMSYFEAMRHVILPQAIRRILPPLGNDFIAMLKDSSLIAVVALPDLLQMGRLHISRTFRAFAGYNTVALMYLVMTFFLSLIVRMVERRMAIVE